MPHQDEGGAVAFVRAISLSRTTSRRCAAVLLTKADGGAAQGQYCNGGYSLQQRFELAAGYGLLFWSTSRRQERVSDIGDRQSNLVGLSRCAISHLVLLELRIDSDEGSSKQRRHTGKNHAKGALGL